MKKLKFNISDIREIQFYLDSLKFRLLEKKNKLEQKELTKLIENEINILEENINHIGIAQEELFQIRTRYK